MNQPIYAIGDIHGDLDKLRAVLTWIDADLMPETRKTHKVVFIGDLTDRRENSRGVIDLLIERISQGAPWIVLKGNHDRMFSLFLEKNGAQDPILRKDLTWLHPRLGGDTTLASYGIEVTEDSDPALLHKQAMEIVPQGHREFLRGLPLTYETESFFFTHAGVNPKIALKDQVEDDLIWIRAPFHDHLEPYEKLIVHGHTPVDEVRHYGNRINIDTGCAYGGPLSVIKIEGSNAVQITANGPAPIKRA